MKKIIKYWYFLVFIIIAIVFLLIDDTKSEKIDVVEESINVQNEKVNVKYYVDIKGEVNNPGVYMIDDDLRINDIILLAGGLTKNADTTLLNLSKKVTDEMNIKIYSKKEVKDARERLNKPTIIEIIKEIEQECVCPDINDACDKIVENSNTQNNKININTATKEELMYINGLGESKANSIIEYRNTNKFNTIEDILNVKGIGESLFEKIKEFIEI